MFGHVVPLLVGLLGKVLEPLGGGALTEELRWVSGVYSLASHLIYLSTFFEWLRCGLSALDPLCHVRSL